MSSQSQPYRRRHKQRHTLTGIVVFIIVAGIFLLLSTTVLFNVENIRVTGASNYTPQEIIDASGVEAGDNLVRLSTDKVSSRITSRLVYIEKAHLSRSFPSTLIINVEASEPEANFITDHGIYLISKGGKILEKIDEPKANLFNFTGTDPKLELLPGDKYASNDEHKDTVVYQMMTLLDTGNYSTVTSVDVTDRADIKCVFDNRITVSLGSVNDLEYKMNFAKEIIETKIGDKTEGTLTILSDANSASFLDKESLENNAQVYNDNIASMTTADTQETDENGNPIETETSETTSAAVAME